MLGDDAAGESRLTTSSIRTPTGVTAYVSQSRSLIGGSKAFANAAEEDWTSGGICSLPVRAASWVASTRRRRPRWATRLSGWRLDHGVRRAAMAMTFRGKSLLCWLRLHHWTPQWTEDGGHFDRCKRCGCDRSNDETYGHSGGGFGG